jgi:hypothetical protein
MADKKAAAASEEILSAEESFDPSKVEGTAEWEDAQKYWAQHPIPEAEASAMKKDELVEAAAERGLDPTGTKAELVERLADGTVEPPEAADTEGGN